MVHNWYCFLCCYLKIVTLLSSSFSGSIFGFFFSFIIVSLIKLIKWMKYKTLINVVGSLTYFLFVLAGAPIWSRSALLLRVSSTFSPTHILFVRISLYLILIWNFLYNLKEKFTSGTYEISAVFNDKQSYLIGPKIFIFMLSFMYNVWLFYIF